MAETIKYRFIQQCAAPKPGADGVPDTGLRITLADGTTKDMRAGGLIPIGATAELDPESPYGKRWLKYKCLRPSSARDRAVESAGDWSPGDDTVRSEVEAQSAKALKAFAKSDARFAGVDGLASLKKAALVDLVCDVCDIPDDADGGDQD